MRRIIILIAIGTLFIIGIQGATAIVMKNSEKNMHEENEYFNDIDNQFVVAGNAINDIKDLTEDSIFTDEWRLQVEEKLDLIHQASNKAQELIPPKSLNEVHDVYLSGFKKFELGLEEVSSGLENKDEKLISKGLALFDEGFRIFSSETEL